MSELFRSMHVPGRPLVLVNVWDALSARLAEAAGATAVATTSGGVSWSLGAADGGMLDRAAAVDAARRIAHAVDVPLSADVEDGFADTPEGVAETVGVLVSAGVAGVNIEDAWHGGPDALRGVRDQSARVAHARAAAGDTLFLNIRTDTYLRGVGAPAERLAETLRRSAAYIDAGADGIFVPGVLDARTIHALVAGIDAPVNVMAGPGALSVGELAALGVARVSLGASVAAASYAVVRRAAREVLAAGTYNALTDALDYGELNELLA